MPEITKFIATCPCGQKNRCLIAKRSRCAACHREFTTGELEVAAMQASIGATFASMGVKRVEWEDGSGFDIEAQQQ